MTSTALAIPTPTPTRDTLDTYRVLSRTHLGRLLLVHRDEVLQLARQRGMTNVRVFGSVARGDTHPHSDIDLLYDLQLGRRVTLLGALGFQHDVEDILHVDVDAGKATALKEYIRKDSDLEVLRI